MSNIDLILENCIASLDETLYQDTDSLFSAFESFVLSNEDVFISLESKDSVAAEKNLIAAWINSDYRPELERFAKEVRAYKKAKDKEGILNCMKKHVLAMKKIEAKLSKIKVENSNEDKLREAKNLLKIFAITNTAVGIVGALIGWLVPMSNNATAAVKGLGIGGAVGSIANLANIGALGIDIHTLEKGLKENNPKYVEQIKNGKTSAQQYKDKMTQMVYEYIVKTEKSIKNLEKEINK